MRGWPPARPSGGTGLAAPGALLPSAYGTAMAFTGQAGSGAVVRDAEIAIGAAIAAPASRALAGLAGAVTGPAVVNADSNVGNQQTVLLLTALIIVAVIWLLVYRSPILWLLPLITIGKLGDRGLPGSVLIGSARRGTRRRSCLLRQSSQLSCGRLISGPVH